MKHVPRVPASVYTLARCPPPRQNGNFFGQQRPSLIIISLCLFLYHLPEHIPGTSGLANQPSELWLSLSLAFFLSTSQSSHQIGEKIQHWISIRLLAPHSLVNTWKGLRLDLNLTLSLTQASPDSWPSLLSIIFWRVWRSVLHSAHASNATFFAWSNALWWNPRWH